MRLGLVRRGEVWLGGAWLGQVRRGLGRLARWGQAAGVAGLGVARSGWAWQGLVPLVHCGHSLFPCSILAWQNKLWPF